MVEIDKKDDIEASIVQEHFQKQLFPMALRLPRTRPNLGETGKNRVKPLHFLTRGRVGGVRSKKNSYSHA